MPYTNDVLSAGISPASTESAGALASTKIRSLAPDAGNAAASAAAGIASPDQTTFSSAAALLVQALSATDVRSEKIAPLQQAILAGTYAVPAGDVAASILSAQQL